MWEGYYVKEPFDLRLTILRMIRNLDKIVLFTLLGTFLFGGGYFVKNVLFGEGIQYGATAVYKVEYTNPPLQSGDYYINEMTWNTYVDSETFYRMLGETNALKPVEEGFPAFVGGKTGMEQMISAAVASDIHVPSVAVRTPDPAKTALLNAAVQEVMTGPFAESLSEVARISVMDSGEVKEVRPDVRPLRALILSAVLSCFFATVILLLREIGADSIWLPATLCRRYGLKTVGTMQSKELKENVSYLFQNCKNVAVCTVNDQVDPSAVVSDVQEILQKKGEKEDAMSDIAWIPAPSTDLSPETARILREADGVLLVVEAGLHAGKPLEYVLDYFVGQDVTVNAALLWNADEALIGSYYFLPGGRR